MSEWIGVEEAYPDDESGYRVIVLANDIVSQWIEIVGYNKNCWMKDGFEYPPIVTHWMPLPEPPK